MPGAGEDEAGLSVTFEDDADRFEVAASGRDRALRRWPVGRRPSRHVLMVVAVVTVVIVSSLVVGVVVVRALTGNHLPDRFAGAWEGTVARTTVRPVRLDLAAAGVGDLVGTSNYDRPGCTGRLTLKAVSDRTVTVAEHIARQGADLTACPVGDVFSLDLTPAGTLHYSAAGGSTGTLSRVPTDGVGEVQGVVSVADIHEADCFSTPPAETPPYRVGCAGPHAAVALRKIYMSGQDYAQGAAARGGGCLFPGEFDLAHGGVPLVATAQIPTRAEWDRGARFAICLVGTKDGSALSGGL